MERIRRRASEHPATLLAGAAMLASGVLLLHWLSRLTFWRDEWDFLLHRRSWSVGTFLDPFVEHLVAASILIYKVGVNAFGMDSARPFQVVSVLLFLTSVGMLFVYVRRRVGEWVALGMILPILFLGPSWDDLLFPFQMALFGSIACGIGAMLVLERGDRAGDLVAMGLLVLGLLFSDLGIPFVAAATILVAATPERFSRAYVIAVPTALWLVWYAGWGHNADTFISFNNFATSPSYMLDGLSASLATWVGLGTQTYDSSPLDWGRPLLVLALGLAAWRLFVIRRPSARLIASAVPVLGFWFLAALNTNPFASATVGRYQYVAIVLLALLASELAAGLRIRRYAVVLVVLAGVAAAIVNGTQLRDAARGLANIAQQERGGLGALELARGRVNPNFELTKQNSGVDYLGLLDAGSYFSAIDAYGSPAYSPAQLVTAPAAARVSADMVSAAALGIRLAPGGQAVPGACLRLDSRAAPEFVVPAQGLLLTANGPGTQVSLRRYASTTFPVQLGILAPGTPELLRTSADRSNRPWSAQLTGGAAVTACRVRVP
jgi:hypothetical protein